MENISDKMEMDDIKKKLRRNESLLNRLFHLTYSGGEPSIHHYMLEASKWVLVCRPLVPPDRL
jgi:organic radical activating enzyme